MLSPGLVTIEFGAAMGRAEKRSSVGKWDEKRKEKNSQRQRHPAQRFIILPAAHGTGEAERG